MSQRKPSKILRQEVNKYSYEFQVQLESNLHSSPEKSVIN